jgi:hypothetical protein
VYLNVLIAIFCGVGLGFVIMFSTQLGKARNKVLVIVLTILAVVLLKYTQWCIYIPLVYSDAWREFQATFGERLILSSEIFFQPDLVFDCAAEINEYGVWGLGSRTSSASSNVNGILLLVVWILEFAIIMAGAIIVSLLKTVFPFSENAQAWYKESKPSIEANCPADPNIFKANLESGNYSELVALVQQGKTDMLNSLGIQIYEPQQSGVMEPYYLTISRKVITIDKKGRQKAASTPLVRFIAADPGTVAILRQPYPQQQQVFTPVS